MLEFAARDYVEIAHQFGVVLATLRKDPPQELDLSGAIQKLLGEANRLVSWSQGKPSANFF
jgi:hypothetical protein